MISCDQINFNLNLLAHHGGLKYIAPRQRPPPAMLSARGRAVHRVDSSENWLVC